MVSLWTLLAAATLAQLAPLPKAFVPPPILMYHRVDVDRPRGRVGRDLTIAPQRFAEQLQYLRSHGIAAIDMAQAGPTAGARRPA